MRYEGLKKCVFLNTRSDRQYRTHQLLSLVFEEIIPEKIIIRGNKLDSIINKYDFESKNIEVIRFNHATNSREISESIS